MPLLKILYEFLLTPPNLNNVSVEESQKICFESDQPLLHIFFVRWQTLVITIFIFK